jgi:DNA-binding PadR family transcriptional regulator
VKKLSKGKIELLENFSKRVVTDFMDILILAKLDEGKSLSGYDFVASLSEEFRIFFSAGTIYSQLYALERQGLLQENMTGRKKVYSISSEAKEYMPFIMNVRSKIKELIEDCARMIANL